MTWQVAQYFVTLWQNIIFCYQMNRILGLLTSILLGSSVLCSAGDSIPQQQVKHKMKLLNHLDLGVTLGTTGIGVDVAMPIGDYVKVRTGVAYMPPITVPMHFDLMNYKPSGSSISSSTFDKAQALMNKLAGFEVNRNVTVNGKPDMFTFKLLADVYPFRTNKHWHFTAGFYLGPKKVANAVNAMKEMPTLVAVGIYNGLYDYIMNTDFVEEPIYNDIYIDPDKGEALKAKFSEYGRIGIHMGDFVDRFVTDADGNVVKDADGNPQHEPFIMEPYKDGTIWANALVNVFRPYIGFGYGEAIDKAKRLNVSFDCGAMFWGGAPRMMSYERIVDYKTVITTDEYGSQTSHKEKIVTYKDVDLARDVQDIHGKAGDYIKVAKQLKVYPVLNFRISYAIF